MDERITIYFNGGCSKCCAALGLLRARGVPLDVVEYLTSPPDAATIRGLLRKLGLRPREIVRDAPPDLDLEDDEAVIAALAARPELLQRPIVVRGDRAVVARPPERALEVL